MKRIGLLLFVTCLLFMTFVSCAADESTHSAPTLPEQPPKYSTKSHPKPTVEQNNIEESGNYLDFGYTNVIAFATVDPFPFMEFTFGLPYDWSTLKDTISHALSDKEIRTLSEVLSGKMNKSTDRTEEPADCFNPRHCIVFFDDKKALIHHVSICFECETMKSSKPHWANYPSLRRFFESIGLRTFDDPREHRKFYDSLASSRRQ